MSLTIDGLPAEGIAHSLDVPQTRERQMVDLQEHIFLSGTFEDRLASFYSLFLIDIKDDVPIRMGKLRQTQQGIR